MTITARDANFQSAVAVLVSHGFNSPDFIKACTVASLLGSLCLGQHPVQPSGPFSIASFGTKSGLLLPTTTVKKHAAQRKVEGSSNSATTLAATLDSIDPSGKSPGFTWQTSS